ncbi:unnamed protein product [Phytophthora fragariaefolia]|uniref:Unnamed protein product n=1 Tax=Phytophthora fragariaefolia TaxID=1490495 RepID=A0A9W6Y3P8_9STRA|nr:unnamed protein product [Phytophthora fragariaefolia]
MRNHSKRSSGMMKAEISRARSVIGTTQNPLAMSREQYQRFLPKSSNKSFTNGIGGPGLIGYPYVIGAAGGAVREVLSFMVSTGAQLNEAESPWYGARRGPPTHLGVCIKRHSPFCDVGHAQIRFSSDSPVDECGDAGFPSSHPEQRYRMQLATIQGPSSDQLDSHFVRQAGSSIRRVDAHSSGDHEGHSQDRMLTHQVSYPEINDVHHVFRQGNLEPRPSYRVVCLIPDSHAVLCYICVDQAPYLTSKGDVQNGHLGTCIEQ